MAYKTQMSAERRYRSIPLHRRWMNEVVHFGKKSHMMGASWRINVSPVVAARAAQQPAIGWTAIWMKALALVSRRRPELRTAYFPFPWARLYQHPEFVCTVVIERTWRGASALFFEKFVAPDRLPLPELDEALRKLRQVPVESVGSFRRLIRFARPPILLRRLLWSVGLNWSGPLRLKYMGGFCVLNPFPTGGTVTQTAVPASLMLYYGLVEPNGEMQVDLFYDHRVMDGVEVFRILRDAEATMNRDIVAELTRAPAAP
jgi:hypothetical protein